ncbi:MAG: tRNA (adenosine(37)-N6)-threonylcarbamoyltransferase complex ATPase subunit type 1 TsaE [Chloroflexi bacterium]|nr:tRNA (adenosine(37)-N6)-threonylcarbamoyltransferase complex ATPase subunit type 1 TsaE [Chloroflexota bacterium]
MLDQQTLELISHSPEQTQRIGQHLASLLGGGEVIGLQGHLGSGKTRLVQGIARGLGVVGPVTSPTFTLIQEYPLQVRGLRRLYHVDLYRLERPTQEALGIGLDEVLGAAGSVSVVEWAERAESLLPADRLWVWLEFMDHTKRLLRLCGYGDRAQALVQALRRGVLGQRL